MAVARAFVRQVYNRIKWDSELRAEEFTIVYEDRLVDGGVAEKVRASLRAAGALAFFLLACVAAYDQRFSMRASFRIVVVLRGSWGLSVIMTRLLSVLIFFGRRLASSAWTTTRTSRGTACTSSAATDRCRLAL